MEAAADLTWNGYSIAERDRRWSAVRKRAAAAGFDGIFVPLGNGTDARYLTQLETAVIVLPTDGRPPVIVTERGRGSTWFGESQAANRNWAGPMTEALREAGMEKARVGVAGLKGGRLTHVRAPDGAIVHSAYAEAVRALPDASFEDATDVVGFARYLKSEEEIACLRRAAAIAEAGIEEMIELARPGLDEAALYAGVMRRMLKLGSEYYPLALHSGPLDGPPSIRHTSPPLGRRLDRGWLITNEVCATWGGMVAQEDQPILLGPVPEEWKPVVDLQREVFEAGLAAMKPGTAFGDLIELVNGFGARRGMKTQILMSGRGLGGDGPLLTPRSRGENVRDIVLENGTTWVWKPYAMTADERIEFVWGGDVVVRDQGGEPLFQRPHGLVSIPG